jgi:hypothetical protein
MFHSALWHDTKGGRLKLGEHPRNPHPYARDHEVRHEIGMFRGQQCRHPAPIGDAHDDSRAGLMHEPIRARFDTRVKAALLETRTPETREIRHQRANRRAQGVLLAFPQRVIEAERVKEQNDLPSDRAKSRNEHSGV